jgi:Meiotically up-regulated gene 113
MKDTILEEIRRIAKQSDGVPPGMRTFENESGIKKSAWRGKFWSKWSDAVSEAGFKPQERTQKLDHDVVMGALAICVRHFGREPSRAELELYKRNVPELPWYQTLIENFKSKKEVFAVLADWASTRSDYQDILHLLPVRASDGTSSSTPANDGHVYLLKSGQFYKIGRGADLEKRVKQIRTSLPDAATLEHSIRTDDPPGIEAYWHNRFSEQRANGEWFKLSTADVAAFKRRKFQ